MFYGTQPVIFERAKQLRQNTTEAEQILWNYLCKSQLGVRFKQQHPIANFIADFYCHQYKLVVELDGSIHNLQEQKESDAIRDEEMKALGITVLRFTNKQVMSDIENVLRTIKDNIVPL